MDTFPDFVALRQSLIKHPDEMIHDLGAEMIGRIRGGECLQDADLVWIIESYERRKPKIIQQSISDGITVKERFGA
jgi:hypothetical protein